MQSIERKLDRVISQLEHLACAVADVAATLAAGSDAEAIKCATARLKASTDALRVSVQANQSSQSHSP
jgi:hypothetical protein